LLTQDYTNLIKGDYSTSSIFENSTPVSDIEVLALDTTRYLISYTTPGYTNFVLYDNTGTALSLVTSVSGFDVQKTALSLLSTDKVIIVFGYGGNTGQSAIITTTSNIITIGVYTTFINFNINNISIGTITPNYAIAIYNDVTNSTSKSQILSISGTTVYSNSVNEIEWNENLPSQQNKIHVLSSTQTIIYFLDTSDKLKCQIFDILGLLILSIGSVQTLGISVLYLNTYKISETHTIITYGTSTYGLCIIGILNNGIVSLSNPVYFTNKVAKYIAISELINNSTYMIIYTNDSSQEVYSTLIIIEDDINIQIHESIIINAFFSTSCATCGMNGKALLLYSDNNQNDIGMMLVFENIITDGSITDYQQIWNSTYSKILANFENSLNAGIANNDIIGWRVKRKASDGNFYVVLNNLDYNEVVLTDYLPRNNIEYTYSVHSVSTIGESPGLNKVDSVDFSGWILTDNNTNTYTFDAGWEGYQTSDISSNKDMYVYENYTQYPVISYGAQNYKTGTITAIPYSFNSILCEYTINEPLRKIIELFINNGEDKWLKNSAGSIFKVATSDFSYKYEDVIQSQPHQITFKWTEIDEGELGL